jgi:general secretion pathway protein L
MGRFIGIDIGATHVRAVLLNVAYKRSTIERIEEVALDAAPSPEAALQACVLPMLQHTDGIAIAVDGDGAFVHRITLPATATKQLDEILPFELEAQVPVDMAELVYDYRVLRRTSAQDAVVVLAAAARSEAVKARIGLTERALSRGPDRVGCGPVSLGNLAALCPALRAPGPIALIDLGGNRTEVTLLKDGEVVFVRTLSQGVAGLPQTAAALAAELRQTLLAWTVSQGEEVQTVHLLGGGSAAQGADAYLAHELGVAVQPMPPLELELLTPDQAQRLPRFGKALALAIGASGKGRDLDLRRGALAFQRGFGFIKEKAPIIAGLVTAAGISFLFANWAEMRSLDREQETLTQQLSVLSKEVLGEEATDAEQATEFIEKAKGSDEVDPMPRLDAFDLMVELSKVVPSSMTHDVEELDMQRGHVKINGVVGSTADAQLIAGKLGEHKCLQGAKIAKVTQAVGSDRQKYVLELDVKCPDDAAKKKKKAETGEAQEGETK